MDFKGTMAALYSSPYQSVWLGVRNAFLSNQHTGSDKMEPIMYFDSDE